jgi:acyl carrier protein
LTKQEKLALLSEIFELDEGELKENISLEELDVWDSMAKLSLIELMDEKFQKILSGEQIRNLKTIKDIMDYME